jgi:hypothetical protein
MLISVVIHAISWPFKTPQSIGDLSTQFNLSTHFRRLYNYNSFL